ncbi:MAG: hypothetical protein LBG84_01745 [Treponema sp.]|nr:hypothetical protein [Treponema sp.]
MRRFSFARGKAPGFFALAVFFCFGAAGLAAETKQIPGSEGVLLYGHPRFITGANSAAGGPVFTTGSYSLTMNPALPADLQCLSADLGYTGLLAAGEDAGHAAALRLGAAAPTRFGVFSAAAQGLFAKEVLGVGNIAIGRLGWSRDVTRNFYLGLSVTGGALFYDGYRDFYIAADLGAWLRFPEIAFLKQVRFAAVAQNLGKTFTQFGPDDGGAAFDIRGYPGMITPKVGAAAHLLEKKGLILGVSADLSVPTLSNLVFNTGLQAVIADLVYVSAGWDFNLWEAAEKWGPGNGRTGFHSPYIGLGVKLSINTSGNETMKKRGFDQTDITADAVWQRLWKDVHLYSLGAAASFGVRDTIPPDIHVGAIRND